MLLLLASSEQIEILKVECDVESWHAVWKFLKESCTQHSSQPE